MKIEYDPKKNQRNIESRNLPFDDIIDIDWERALIWNDTRKEYPEIRFSGLGELNDRVYAFCFTPIQGGIRVISFRKANRREIKKYETARNLH